MADDENHRPCLPLKPQEKNLIQVRNILNPYYLKIEKLN